MLPNNGGALSLRAGFVVTAMTERDSEWGGAKPSCQSSLATTCSRPPTNRCHPPLAPW
jgi:hypothetical protein